ncbi:MAG: dephospho-CoA kinase [Actinobacteria bacterium]|nr:dephospho-CoA kinase [Actinomycetota bacterium]
MFKIKVIGIVGKTGCGKSFASDYLAKKLKSSIKLDVDLLAKEIYKKNKYIVNQITNCFGEDILKSDGSINFLYLGKKVFSDKNEIKKLNNIMFPLIYNEVSDFIKRNSYKKYIIIDAAILFDANLDNFCNKVILIKTMAKKRQSFLKCKNLNLCDEDINQRVKNQRIKIKKDKVDFIIENNSSIESLYRKLDIIINDI